MAIKPEDVKKHMVHETGDLRPEAFKVYAGIVAKAARTSGIYGPRSALDENEIIAELFARGYLEYDSDGNVVVPAVRKLVPSIFGR